MKSTKNGAGNKKNGEKNLTRATKTLAITTTTKQATEVRKNCELSTHSVIHVAKGTAPQRKVCLESMQQKDRFLGIEDRWDAANLDNTIHTILQVRVSKLQPKT